MTRSKTTNPKKYDPLKPKLDVHEAITQKIVAAIEAGAGTFAMPWHRPGVTFTLPKNALTERAYRGSNILSLWIDADEKKFEHQVWATFKQWLELDAPVRKGEKGSLIVKYGEWVPRAEGPAGSRLASGTTGHPKRNESDNEDGAKRLFAKAAHVFNIDQVELSAELRAKLIPAEKPRPDLTTRLDAVDRFIANIGIEIREAGSRAFYRHRGLNGDGDFIQMPPRALFTGTETSTPTEAYYSTLLHEEIHGSGAQHRLDRQYGERFGDKVYAFEELVAELGAAFLCAHLEVTNTPRLDHAQYCASWLEVLKGDAKAIFTAASHATRAVEFLCGLQPGADPNAEPTVDATSSEDDASGTANAARPGDAICEPGQSRIAGPRQ